MATYKEMMERLGVTASYDTAKPHEWMVKMGEAGFDQRELYMNYLWLYDEQGRIWGRPYDVRGNYQRWCEEHAVVIDEDLYEQLYRFLDSRSDVDEANRLLNRLMECNSKTKLW